MATKKKAPVKKKVNSKVKTKVKQVTDIYLITHKPEKSISDFKEPVKLLSLTEDMIEFQNSDGYEFLQTENFGLFRVERDTRSVTVQKRKIGF